MTRKYISLFGVFIALVLMAGFYLYKQSIKVPVSPSKNLSGDSYHSRRKSLENNLWNLISQSDLEFDSDRTTRIGYIYISVLSQISIEEQSENPEMLSLLYKIRDLAIEINRLPRGYIYDKTLYETSGFEVGHSKKEVFHSDKPWAIIMTGYMNIEVYQANDVDGYSWLDVQLINHSWCLSDRAESVVYPPGEYVFGLVSRGEGKWWKVTVKEVVDLDPRVANEFYYVSKMPESDNWGILIDVQPSELKRYK